MKLMHDGIEITDSTYAPMMSFDVQDRIPGLSGRAMAIPGNELEPHLSSSGKENLGCAMVFKTGKLTPYIDPKPPIAQKDQARLKMDRRLNIAGLGILAW